MSTTYLDPISVPKLELSLQFNRATIEENSGQIIETDLYAEIDQNYRHQMAINTFTSTKINKSIEIVTIEKRTDVTMNRKNVGIELEERVVYDILSRGYEHVMITIIQTRNDLERLVERKPDLVFSGIKYFNFNDCVDNQSEEIWLSNYLDKHGISYISSNKEALNNEYNKENAKHIIQQAKISTAKFFTTQPDENMTEESIDIEYPLFLKPITGGDSRGIDKDSLVFNFESFKKKVLDIYEHQNSRTMVETYLSGKEYSVGIIENRSKGTLRAMPIEIIACKNKNGHRILDYNVKKNDTEKVIAVTDKKIHDALSSLAKDAFRALSGKSIGRIDIKMDYNGIPNFIEANFMPGLRRGYFYQGFYLNENMTHDEMILAIADAALS